MLNQESQIRSVNRHDPASVDDTGREGMSQSSQSHREAPDADHLQKLIEQVQTLSDSTARGLAQQCIQSVLELYGRGLARVLQLIENEGEQGRSVRDALLQDRLVRSLILVHGLHPVDLETRLRQALDQIRPYMESHGGNIELIDIVDDVARLRFGGACQSCPSSGITMELAVRRAVEEACPDLLGLQLDGPAATTPPFKASRPSQSPGWVTLAATEKMSSGDTKAIGVMGVPLILCKLGETFYTYHNRCPACGGALDEEGLTDGWLKCRLGHRYQVRQAGRSPDDPNLHLTPIPLLVENGSVKVALK